MSSPNIEELYKCYEIISNKDIELEKRKDSYKKILLGVSGDEKEKRLATQFIVNFFELFEDLHKDAFDKLLDLCEEENITIRKQVIQLFPTIGKKVSSYTPKIADTLSQMFETEDSSEITMISAALNSMISGNDEKIVIESIFNQLLTQLEETSDLVNTFAFRFLADKFGQMQDIKPEIETVIETNCTKLLDKLVGKEEFHLVITILSTLKSNSQLLGRQKLVNILTEKTKVIGLLNDVNKFNVVMLNAAVAIKLISKNVNADELLAYLISNIEHISKLDLSSENTEFTLSDVLETLVDLGIRAQTTPEILVNTSLVKPELITSDEKCADNMKNLFNVCFEHFIPVVPDEIKEEEITKLAGERQLVTDAEKSLLAVYYVCRYHPESVVIDDKVKSRLQYLGRIVQVAHKTANEALALLSKQQKKMEENRLVTTLPKTTNNLQILVRELFKTPVSYKTVISPSWLIVPVSNEPPTNQNGGKKRPASAMYNNRPNFMINRPNKMPNYGNRFGGGPGAGGYGRNFNNSGMFRGGRRGGFRGGRNRNMRGQGSFYY